MRKLRRSKKWFGCLALSAALLCGTVFAPVRAAQGGALSGSVTSSDSQTNTVSLSLLSGGKLTYSVTVTGNKASYDFGEVAPGSYTLRVEKALHVTRDYEVTVSTSAVKQDLTLLQLGDVTQDGKVNIGDTARIYAHIRGINKLTDSYILSCADTTGDERVTIGDAARAYGNLRSVLSVQLYTVTFKDHDGSVLKTQIVEAGKSVTPPVAPQRSGFTFDGWDKDFSKVNTDLTVTARYSGVQGAAFVVENVTGAPGETVEVPVSIVNNPGVAGARITFSYDRVLTLSAARSGDAFSALQYTGPGQFVSPCNFTWDSESGMVVEDGTVLVLSFQIPANASPGETYEINCTYREGDIYDEDLNDVSLQTVSGVLTVS